MKTYKMKINGEEYSTKIKKYKNDLVIVEVNGLDYEVHLEKERRKENIVRSDKARPALDFVKTSAKPAVATPGVVVAPIPGLILRILVKEGETINAGDTVLILEAMKMESEITSTASGVVTKIIAREGISVQESDPLIEVGE